MGQRHQMFVIARVNGRYRNLCAIHHQWFDGDTALEQCSWTLNIFEDPANKIPIQQELIAAQRHDEDFWTATHDGYYRVQYRKECYVPFPFIATCLITGGSFGPDNGDYHAVTVLPFQMEFDKGDNNSGITIFDITDPSDVHYCFVDFHGMASERTVPLMTPLAARTYIQAYQDLSDPQTPEYLLPLVDCVEQWDIIPVAALQETWPKGKWEEQKSYHEDGDEVTAPEIKKRKISTAKISKSLRDGAMSTVIQTLLEGPDNSIGLLLEAELLIDFLPKLKAKLYEQASALKPSTHLLSLLCRALEHETDVDLSPFTAFSAEDMSLVVSRLRKRGNMTTLCISNRPDITEVDLRVVLQDAAGLKALYVLEDPQIPAQGMCTLLGKCDLYHSDLLRRPIDPYHSDLMRRSIDPRGEESYEHIESEVWAYNDVSQLAWIGISAQQALDKGHRLESGMFDWKSLRQEQHQHMFDRNYSNLKYDRYPLDMPLPTFKTVTGLLRLLKWGSSASLYRAENFSRGAAFSFAMPSLDLNGKDLEGGPVGVGSEFGIGPLGTALYLDSTHDRIPPSDAHKHLNPGQWAIMLVHEAFDAGSEKYLDSLRQRHFATTGSRPSRAIRRLRYALVTPSTTTGLKPSGHDFIVADIPTFLEHTMGRSQGKGKDGDSQKLIEVWNSQIALIDDVDFYSDEDIHDILPKVFPSQTAASSGSRPE